MWLQILLLRLPNHLEGFLGPLGLDARVLEVNVWLQISLQDLPAHLKSFLGQLGLDESVDKSIGGDEVWLQMHFPDHPEGSLGQLALSKALMRALEVTACGCRSCCCISLITLKASLGNLALSKALRRVLEMKVWLQISLLRLSVHLVFVLGLLVPGESTK